MSPFGLVVGETLKMMAVESATLEHATHAPSHHILLRRAFQIAFILL
jgi:hypothetical protein